MKFILASLLLTGINGFPAPEYGSGALMRRQQAPSAPVQDQAQAQAGASNGDVSDRWFGYPYYGYYSYYNYYPYYYYGRPYYGWPYWRSGVNGEGDAQAQPNQQAPPNTF